MSRHLAGNSSLNALVVSQPCQTCNRSRINVKGEQVVFQLFKDPKCRPLFLIPHPAPPAWSDAERRSLASKASPPKDRCSASQLCAAVAWSGYSR